MLKRGASHDGIVIVGGGLAGQRCTESLRRNGYDGPIRLVCGESHLPYDRPPLSKQVLTGSASEGSTTFRSPSWYEEQDVDLLLAAPAAALDLVQRRVRLANGSVLKFDWLLIATGGRPRTVPGLETGHRVSTLRTRDDATRLRDLLRDGARLAVIGAGFIGQEVAASARALGAGVTMIEAARSPLVSVLGPALGDWFTRLHRAEGVAVFAGCTVTQVVNNGSLRLDISNGATVEADHILVGTGIRPNLEWVADTQLHTAGGIPVDADGRTACERVLAAGDAAATFDPIAGRHVAGSHWEAAGRQGSRAARIMLGLDPGAVPLTSFWTDQYGIRIQYLGHAQLADRVEIDGQPEDRSFTAIFKRAGRAVAALLVNRPRSLPAARKLIEKGLT